MHFGLLYLPHVTGTTKFGRQIMTTIAQQILIKKNSYNKSKKHSIFKISVSCNIEHNFLSVIQILLLTTIRKTDVQKYFLPLDVSLLSRNKSQ
jgi:hypothetical protein